MMSSNFVYVVTMMPVPMGIVLMCLIAARLICQAKMPPVKLL